MEKQSPVQRIWELGKDEHGKLITAVILAVVGVVCGMVPYFAAAKMIALLLAGERALGVYTGWLIAALCGFLARTGARASSRGLSTATTRMSAEAGRISPAASASASPLPAPCSRTRR